MIRNWLKNITLGIGLALLIQSPLLAFSQKQQTDLVAVELISQYDAINPKQNMGILFKFTIADGWHIFSQKPGEIGMPTTVIWNLPPELKTIDGNWSPDKEFENEGFIQRGFANEAYYQTALIPTQPLSDNYNIEVIVKWLACKGTCHPQQKTFKFSLPYSEFEQVETAQWQNTWNEAQQIFSANNNSNIWWILLMALLGGIIMNAMPCVFPILFIKILALTQTTSTPQMRASKGISYCLGVILSFLVIASILLALRSGGEAIGWGFQMQSPWFVGCLAVLFVIIGLMLLDVINIRAPFADSYAQILFSNPLISSFATGFLAVIIATPCSAPFMGIAIGYALSAPTYHYYPVFLSLGLGYALPFTLAELFPHRLQKIMPKHGKWMDVLKKFFAIPIFLTALWLIWVLYNQLNPTPKEINWRAYDKTEVEQLITQKEPVFINFTAKWCLTCMLNKKTTLDKEEFINVVKQHQIHLIEADWTNNDDHISSALEYYKQNAVPLYVFYGSNGEYVILPQLLTPKIAIEKMRLE